MREVEPEIVGRDEATLLRDMRAEPVTQRRVQQVCCAVIGAGAVAPLGIDRLVDRLPDRNLARLDDRPEHMEPAQWLRRVLNFSDETLESCQLSCVANLPAAFAVKGRLVRDDFHRFPDLALSTRFPSLTMARTMPSPSSPE